MKIYALHGFLGLPSDFDFLQCEKVTIKPAANFKEWAREFNREVIRDGSQEKSILLGYSMGGRLALQAWADRPTLWEKLILVSAHPGLRDEKERQKRIESDEVWAKRFESESWDTLMRDWNGQEVLKGFQVNREEMDYNRKELASYLRNFSLGKQEVIEPDDAIWMVGENDAKFRKSLDHLNPIVVPDVGHRIIYEKPETIKGIIQQVIAQKQALSLT